MRPLLLQIPFGKLKAHETGRPCTIRGPGNELESVFYGKLTRTAIPKILSVSLLTAKEHPDKVKEKSARNFFHNL